MVADVNTFILRICIYTGHVIIFSNVTDSQYFDAIALGQLRVSTLANANDANASLSWLLSHVGFQKNLIWWTELINTDKIWVTANSIVYRAKRRAQNMQTWCIQTRNLEDNAVCRTRPLESLGKKNSKDFCFHWLSFILSCSVRLFWPHWQLCSTCNHFCHGVIALLTFSAEAKAIFSNHRAARHETCRGARTSTFKDRRYTYQSNGCR